MVLKYPPGPSALQTNRNPIDLLEDLKATYGDFVRYGTSFGVTTFINHPPTVSRVLYNKDEFQRAKVISIAIGDGLLASEGELWHSQRRAYQPKFHPQALQTYAEAMAEEAEVTVEQWKVKMAKGESVELLDEMLKYSLRVAARIFMGDTVGSGKLNEALCDATSQVITYLGQMCSTLPISYTPEDNKNQRIALGLLNRVIKEFVDRRRDRPEGFDLLGTLMMAKDEDGNPALSPKLLRDEVATMLLGGHETTAISMAWATWELAMHDDFAEEICQTEWADVLKGERPGWDHLMSLPKTQSAIREIHRLHPPIWSLLRRVAQDTEVEGFTLHKDEHVIVSPYMTHRHPDAWEDPLTIQFDRFINGIPKEQMKGSYIPFGVGPHTCVGQHVANMEMLIALPILLREFKLVPLDRSDPGVLPLITLRPGRPVVVRLEPRVS